MRLDWTVPAWLFILPLIINVNVILGWGFFRSFPDIAECPETKNVNNFTKHEM